MSDVHHRLTSIHEVVFARCAVLMCPVYASQVSAVLGKFELCRAVQLKLSALADVQQHRHCTK